MAIALDQNLGVTQGLGGSTSWAHTTTATAAANSRIILAVSWFTTAITISSCSGGGLTWVVDQQSASDNNEKLAFISADAPAGLASGTTITVTASGTAGTSAHVAAASFTGLATGASGYTTGTPGASDTTTTGTAWQTPNVTTTVADALLFAISCNDGTSPESSTTTAPATEIHDDHHAPSFQTLTTAYRIVAATSTYSIAGTWAFTLGENRRGIIAYAAGAGAPTPTPIPARSLPSMLLGRPAVAPSKTPSYVEADFPSTSLLDDFNRGSLGANWTSQWLTAGGLATITGNQVGSSSGAADAGWNPMAFGPDCECWFTVTVLPLAGATTRLLLRQQTLRNVVGDGYRLQITDGQWQFRVSTSGATADIGAPITWPIAAGDAVGFRAVGTTLSAFYSRGADPGNWTLVGSITDTTLPNVIGYAGFQVGDTTSFIDDFGGGSLTTVTPTVPLPRNGLSDPFFPPTGLTLYPSQRIYYPPIGGTLFPQALTATIIATATILNQVGKLMSATVTSTATMVKQAGKSQSATVTSTASFVKQVGKLLSATVTSTASLLAQKVKQVAMSATVTSTATLIKQVGKPLSATVTSTASIVKQVGKNLSATVTSTATMAAIKVILRTLTATVTSSATMVRQAQIRFNATVTSSASLVKQVGKRLTATTVTSTASLVALRVFLRTLTATVTSTATMVRQAQIRFNATVTTVASIAKRVTKTLTATVTSVASLVANFVVQLVGPFAASLSVTDVIRNELGISDLSAVTVAIADQSGPNVTISESAPSASVQDASGADVRVDDIVP